MHSLGPEFEPQDPHVKEKKGAGEHLLATVARQRQAGLWSLLSSSMKEIRKVKEPALGHTAWLLASRSFSPSGTKTAASAPWEGSPCAEHLCRLRAPQEGNHVLPCVRVPSGKKRLLRARSWEQMCCPKGHCAHLWSASCYPPQAAHKPLIPKAPNSGDLGLGDSKSEKK